MNIATAPSSRWPSPNLPLVGEHVFETMSSETRYTGRIFALRTDHVRMPGGNIAIREVVEHYGAVAVVAMDDDGNPFGRRLWELPAGLLDVDGEAPHLTAARELREEAGLQAQTWQVLVDLNSTPGFSDESVRVYLATRLTQVDQPEAHDEEADMTLQWFPIAEAARRAIAGEIVNSIATSGILAAYAIRKGFGQPRQVDAPWIDRPTAFTARQAGR
jgi:8-oxo-dGTP pyrophosphatase MutT (NUDIX family)